MTTAAMSARILDGTAIAKSIRERIGADIAQKQQLNPRYKPSLKIIQGAQRNSYPPARDITLPPFTDIILMD